MAYGSTSAGVITKETTISIRRVPVAASTTITKGQVCNSDTSGNLVTSTTAIVAEVNHFVALETIDNSAGSAADLYCPVAVTGHYVTVIAGDAIVAGERVVASAGTAGEVRAYVAATHAIDQVVGIYWGKESGTVATDGSTPYAETFTDTADFSPANAADNDVIEVELL
jgi:hypothetical protein